MSEYCHYVAGFFARREEVDSAFSRLVERGLPRERLRIFESDSDLSAPVQQAQSKEVLHNVLVDGAIGTAAGAGIGGLVELALVAANVSLFVASPLVAPLMLLGWGASLGGFIGATAGAAGDAGNQNRHFADLIRDALGSGQVVLLVETRTEQETAIAQDIVQASLGDSTEVSAG
jgi:hypothetical protein